MLVTGCGFHLRGSVSQGPPLPPVHIESMGPSAEEVDVARSLEQWLRQQDVNVVSSGAGTGWIVVLYPEKRNRRVLSVNSAGKVQEYELHYQLRFEVHDSGDKILLPARVVAVTRQYAFDAEAVLSKAGEEDALWQAMQQEAVQRLGLQLQRLAARQEPDGS